MEGIGLRGFDSSDAAAAQLSNSAKIGSRTLDFFFDDFFFFGFVATIPDVCRILVPRGGEGEKQLAE